MLCLWLIAAGYQLAQNAADLLSFTTESSVESILDELDQQADGIQYGQRLWNGPFHVFRYTNEMSPSIQLDSLSDVFASEFWDPLLPDVGHGLDDNSSLQLIETPGLLSLGDVELQAGSQTMDVLDPLSPPSPAVALETSSIPTPRIFSSSQDCPSDLVDFTMSTAQQLLDHYRHTLVPFFTPARVESQSPWEAVYIPSVFSTVGEIMLAGDSGNAKVSLLFAIFAISAFSLDGLSSSTDEPVCQDWHALGELYRGRATKRLKRSLQDLSVNQPKKEKYKDILMALLSMVTICVVSGKMKNAAHYLWDIEKIISLHGVKKVTRSSKVRMLHSIYLYLRVLTERTCIDDQPSRSDAIEESRGLPIYSSSSTQLSSWDQLLGPCSPPPSANGLDSYGILHHVPCKSAFEEIYSVPQSLFKLILETTQMAGEVDQLQSLGRSKTTDYDAFAAKIKDLESNICNWEYHTTRHNLGYPLSEQFPFHLVQAVQKALLIYFYRCVRDVNAAILQQYVQQTIYHLLEYDKQKERYGDQSSNTCWPGFIAGCEALEPRLREQIARWLERSGQSTGIRMYTVALEAVQKVWQARSSPGMQSAPWTQVLEKYSDLRVLVLS
ncbi:hypothetical protein MAP00_003810 [Monascus purpureus]|nr:hypothetical protein MAP00_003810 [Monascus purpureus]